MAKETALARTLVSREELSWEERNSAGKTAFHWHSLTAAIHPKGPLWSSATQLPKKGKGKWATQAGAHGLP